MISNVYEELKSIEYRIDQRQRRMHDKMRRYRLKNLNIQLDLSPFSSALRSSLRKKHAVLFGETPKRSIMDKIRGRKKDIPVLHIPTKMRAQGDSLFFVFPKKATYKNNDILGFPEFSIENKNLNLRKYAMSSFTVGDKTMPSDEPVVVHQHSLTAVLFHKNVKVCVEFE